MTDLIRLFNSSTIGFNSYAREFLINSISRNYVSSIQYDLAYQFLSQIHISETFSSRQENCSHLYYLGIIHAIKYEYSKAKNFLDQAMIEASLVSFGLRIQIQKWRVLISLLIGEIPAKSEFSIKKTMTDLLAYKRLTQYLHQSKCRKIDKIITRFKEDFFQDRTTILVERLRRIVLRFGLSRIFNVYTRISVSAILAELRLEFNEDNEYRVAKKLQLENSNFILELDNGTMQRKIICDENLRTPQKFLYQRILSNLKLHNQLYRGLFSEKH